LLLFSTLTNKQKVEEFIKENLFEFKLINQTKIHFEILYVYELTKNQFLKQLDQKGVTNIQRLTKGHRGLIYTGKFKSEKVAVKIQRQDIEAKNTVNNEINQLNKLNKKGIGPTLLFGGKDFFGYKFVEGELILDALITRTKPQIQNILLDLFNQCFILDQLGLNKEEMHHPLKHVLISKKNKVTLLDFERCKHSIKVKNVTQCCQFICSGKLQLILLKKEININKTQLLAAAKDYKQKPSRSRFEVIINLMQK